MRISATTGLTNYNKDSRYSNMKNNKSNPLLFQGLTKRLKNEIYLDGQKDIELILNEKPNTNPVVGQLPNFIFKNYQKIIEENLF